MACQRVTDVLTPKALLGRVFRALPIVLLVLAANEPLPPAAPGKTLSEGVDTWVRIGPVQGGGKNSLAVDVWAGNAGTKNPPRQVSTWVRVATASGTTVCYELVYPAEVWLIHGDSYRLVRFQVNYPSPPQLGSSPPTKYTISAEVFYDDGPTSQFEANTANNQQVVTYPFPAGGTPHCMKVVGMDNIFESALYPVFSHGRCVNCHGRVAANGCTHHVFEWCGSRRDGHDENNNPCSLCHSTPGWTNVGAPPFWDFDPTTPLHNTERGVTRSPRDLCYTVKHTFIAQSLQLFQQHISGDPRIQWGFNPTPPPEHAIPAPGGYQAWQQNMLTWFNQGLPCPPFPSPP